MNQWLIALLVIVIIAIIWYLMRERARAAEQQRLEASRRLQAGARAAERAPLTAAGAATAAGAEAEGAASRAGGLLQEAADRATGVGFERATDKMEGMTADLAEARREADLAAERLAGRADDALGEIQVAAAAEAAEATGTAEAIVVEAELIPGRENGERADIVAEAIEAADAGGVPPGAIRGDGGRDCPPAYPIKGNRSSMLYHEPGTPTYESTIPEFCFSSVGAATAAGFSATRF